MYMLANLINRRTRFAKKGNHKLIALQSRFGIKFIKRTGIVI